MEDLVAKIKAIDAQIEELKQQKRQIRAEIRQNKPRRRSMEEFHQSLRHLKYKNLLYRFFSGEKPKDLALELGVSYTRIRDKIHELLGRRYFELVELHRQSGFDGEIQDWLFQNPEILKDE